MRPHFVYASNSTAMLFGPQTTLQTPSSLPLVCHAGESFTHLIFWLCYLYLGVFCRLYSSFLQYLIQGRVLSTALLLRPWTMLQSSSFLPLYLKQNAPPKSALSSFFYKGLGALPRLLKYLEAILHEEKINFLCPIYLQRCITVIFVRDLIIHPGGDNHCMDESYTSLNSLPFSSIPDNINFHLSNAQPRCHLFRGLHHLSWRRELQATFAQTIPTFRSNLWPLASFIHQSTLPPSPKFFAQTIPTLRPDFWPLASFIISPLCKLCQNSVEAKTIAAIR